MSVPISWYLLLAAALFAMGAFGALARSHALTVMLSIQLMLNAVNLTAMAFATQMNDPVAHILIPVVVIVAFVEAALGAVIFLAFQRRRRTIDLDRIDLMRG